MTNPTQALDAIEKALTDCKKLLVAIKNSNDLDGRIAFLPQKTEEAIQNAFDALAHLATLKQQVAELVAFREAHQWERPLPSEALYSFAGWLTGRNEAVTFSANHESGIAAELVNAFCKANDFDSPRDGIWPGNVKHPPAADGGQPHDH